MFQDIVPNGAWEFNAMLVNIAKKMKEEDLKCTRLLLSDITCVSDRDSEKLTTPASFLLFLKQRQILARDNVLLLQAILRCLKREDLLEIVDNYARTIGNTLYWYKAPDEPATGFIHVRFYVDGNLESFQRPKLEKLREYVARLLGVPKEFIFLVGVEEGSVILTFMISEQHADQLKDLFEKHKDGFRQFGVDGIRVVDPPTVDEQSLDPRTESEENKEDFSTQTYLERAPIGDIQSQLSAIYDRQNQMTSQLGERKETSDDRKNQMTSQLGELEKTTELRELHDELRPLGPISTELRRLHNELSLSSPISKENLQELNYEWDFPFLHSEEIRRFRDELRLPVPISKGKTEWEQKMAKASTEFQEDKFSPPFPSPSARLTSGVKTPQTNPYGEQKGLRGGMSPSGITSKGKLQILRDDLDSLEISFEGKLQSLREHLDFLEISFEGKLQSLREHLDSLEISFEGEIPGREQAGTEMKEEQTRRAAETK